jgi:hypothetical protein
VQKVYHRDEWGADDARSVQRFNHTVNWALITGNYTEKCFNFVSFGTWIFELIF